MSEVNLKHQTRKHTARANIDLTLPSQAAPVRVRMGSWPSITSGKSTAFMEWKVARSSAWTFLVTQGPTCPIAALLYALVSDAEGPYLNRLSQRKPLSVSDICPAKLVTWHPVIPWVAFDDESATMS